MKRYIVYDKVTHEQLREGQCPDKAMAEQAIEDNEAVVEANRCFKHIIIVPMGDQ